jgi:uncharacterized protein YdiU (UPF0061 family)
LEVAEWTAMKRREHKVKGEGVLKYSRATSGRMALRSGEVRDRRKE